MDERSRRQDVSNNFLEMVISAISGKKREQRSFNA